MSIKSEKLNGRERKAVPILFFPRVGPAFAKAFRHSCRLSGFHSSFHISCKPSLVSAASCNPKTVVHVTQTPGLCEQPENTASFWSLQMLESFGKHQPCSSAASCSATTAKDTQTRKPQVWRSHFWRLFLLWKVPSLLTKAWQVSSVWPQVFAAQRSSLNVCSGTSAKKMQWSRTALGKHPSLSGKSTKALGSIRIRKIKEFKAKQGLLEGHLESKNPPSELRDRDTALSSEDEQQCWNTHRHGKEI